LGAEARTGAASPALSSKVHASGTSLLTAASRHLARGDSAGLRGGFAALAATPLLGFLVAASGDAKIKRLRAMYKTGQITYTQLYAFSSAAKSRQN